MLANATKATEALAPTETNTGSVNLEKIPVLTDNMGDWCTKKAQQHLLNLKAYYRQAIAGSRRPPNGGRDCISMGSMGSMVFLWDLWDLWFHLLSHSHISVLDIFVRQNY